MSSRSSFPPQPLPPNRRAYVLLLALFMVSVVTALLTQGTFDSGDSINHYLFARYAFAHPINFLESWSKPLIVELMAGPAQLGWRAVSVYQCVLVAASAALAYQAARYLRLPWPWLAILFCYASPDYFLIQFSGLTEPTFALVLMGGVALALRGHAGWGAVVLSLLPFARSEGYMMVGVYAIYLVLTRQWRLVPLLGVGFVAYGLAGMFVYHDFWWAFTRNAYPLQNPNYGHGAPSHYLKELPNTVGWVLYGLFWVGGLRMLAEWARPRLRRQPGLFTAELLLVYGNVVVFIVAHAIFWTFGIFGSLGLVRVMCGLVPLMSLVALRGVVALSELATAPRSQARIRGVLAVAVVGFLFCGSREAFRWERDFQRASDQLLLDTAARWALRQGPPVHVAYAHPYVALPLHVDPFGPQRSDIRAATAPDQDLPKGSLVFWDEWHAVVDGQVPFEALYRNPRYRLRWLGAMPRSRRKPTADSVRVAVFERL